MYLCIKSNFLAINALCCTLFLLLLTQKYILKKQITHEFTCLAILYRMGRPIIKSDKQNQCLLYVFLK